MREHPGYNYSHDMGQDSGSKTPSLKIVEAKLNFMRNHDDDFAALFSPLVQRGLPFFWE